MDRLDDMNTETPYSIELGKTFPAGVYMVSPELRAGIDLLFDQSVSPSTMITPLSHHCLQSEYQGHLVYLYI